MSGGWHSYTLPLPALCVQLHSLQSTTTLHSASGSFVACAGGENEFIWQAWAVLEGKLGNAGYARKVCRPWWLDARFFCFLCVCCSM